MSTPDRLRVPQVHRADVADLADRAARRSADLADRAARRSRDSARRRLRRLLSRVVFILQCGVGAATAWWVAHDLIGHPTPFFAPVTAMICLGMSYGQRLRRAGEVMLGVAVGVFTGDAFVHFFDSGIWQIAVVAVLAMGIAALLGAGMLLTTQAGVQAVIVTTLVAQPGQAFSRWLDAVVGGAVAILITWLAPAAPILRPRQRAAGVLHEVGGILRDVAEAVRTSDDDLASQTLDRARRSEDLLVELKEASDEGVAVVRLSLLRRRHLPSVQAIADLLEPLDRAVRNLRVLARRGAIAAWRDEPVPSAYLVLLTSLAEVCEDMADELDERRLPQHAVVGLLSIGEVSAVIDTHTGLSAEVMRAQIRSMVVDLLMLTGMPYDEARDCVPESESLLPEDDDEAYDDEPAALDEDGTVSEPDHMVVDER